MGKTEGQLNGPPTKVLVIWPLVNKQLVALQTYFSALLFFILHKKNEKIMFKFVNHYNKSLKRLISNNTEIIDVLHLALLKVNNLFIHTSVC